MASFIAGRPWPFALWKLLKSCQIRVLGSHNCASCGIGLIPVPKFSSIYLYVVYVVAPWTISRRLLVGAQTLAHSGNDLRDCGGFANSFSISVAGGGPCAARAYRLRELCKRP